MARRRALFALVSSLTALAALTHAPSAIACEPPLPGLTSSIPPAGSTYPSNGAIFFIGFDISLANVTVTANALPGPYALKPTSFPSDLGLSATLDPPVPAGHTATISGDFCVQPGFCQPVTIDVAMGLPDTEPPAPVQLTSFNVYDYIDYKSSGGDCTSDSDVAYWLKLQAPAPTFDSAQVFYTVEAYRDASLQDLVITRSGFVQSEGEISVELRLMASQLGGKPAAEALCFVVKTQDAAGNTPDETSAVLCKPCFSRVGVTPDMGFGPPPEPQWTAADAYPGGPCDMGTSSSSSGGAGGGGGSGGGGDGDSFGGCGCRTSSEGSTGAALSLALALSAIGAAARRRRARR